MNASHQDKRANGPCPPLPPPPPGLPVPKPREVIPRIITYQRKRANRRILNEPEFIEMLKEFGELQVGGMHTGRGGTACRRLLHGTWKGADRATLLCPVP